MTTPLIRRVPRPAAHRRLQAFSLTEVALAIGLVAFVLVSLLGLMNVGMNASRASRDYTTGADIARRVKSGLTSKPFAEIANSTEYYDSEGRPSGESVAYFVCEVETAPPNIYLSGVTSPDSVKQLRMELSWPKERPLSARSRRTLHTLVADYD